jgi:hypothetical protein
MGLPGLTKLSFPSFLNVAITLFCPFFKVNVLPEISNVWAFLKVAEISD